MKSCNRGRHPVPPSVEGNTSSCVSLTPIPVSVYLSVSVCLCLCLCLCFGLSLCVFVSVSPGHVASEGLYGCIYKRPDAELELPCVARLPRPPLGRCSRIRTRWRVVHRACLIARVFGLIVQCFCLVSIHYLPQHATRKLLQRYDNLVGWWAKRSDLLTSLTNEKNETIR